MLDFVMFAAGIGLDSSRITADEPGFPPWGDREIPTAVKVPRDFSNFERASRMRSWRMGPTGG
jgi:hypothetical protein